MPSSPERKARSDRLGPGAHLIPPHLGASGPGRSGGSWALLLEVEARAIASLLCGPDPGCSTPPPARLCAGVLTPCCPGATPRAGPQPPPLPPASPTVSNRNGPGEGCRLSFLRWRQGECQGCCLRPHPARVRRKVPGKSQVLETGASSSGRSRGLAALGPLRPGLGFTGVQSNLGHWKEKRAVGPSCNAVAVSDPTF